MNIKKSLIIIFLFSGIFLFSENQQPIDITNISQSDFLELLDFYVENVNAQLQTMQIAIEIDDWNERIICTMFPEADAPPKRFALEEKRMRTIAGRLWEKLRQNKWAQNLELEFRQKAKSENF